MKIFNSGQIKNIDALTIQTEPVSSVDLMERAARQVLHWYMNKFDRSGRVLIFAGPGNNGGDGLALARMLNSNRFNTLAFYVDFTDKTSDDWKINFNRLKEAGLPIHIIKGKDMFPVTYPSDIIIDAIFGSGLTRPPEGLAADTIKFINKAGCTVISIDIPSGLFGEDNSNNNPESIVMADFTLSFQFPKLAFMFAENEKYTGEWVLLPIGLSNKAINETETPFSYLESDSVVHLIRKRRRFDHKGIYGHGLLIAGSYGKMGAAILGSKAALRTGTGLITVQVPACGYMIIQTAVPEVMVKADNNEKYLSDTPDIDMFDAIGVGPGIGMDPATQKTFHSLLLNRTKPFVIDADGLNILGINKKWLSVLPYKTVLTPHLKEFERIAGKSENGYVRLEKQIEFASKYNCVVVLKGAFTSIATPDGKVFFNSTGNPGMATAGSGDVLTGIILSFLAQGYSPESAAVAGVYIHGLAGDIAVEATGQESLIASDIIDNIGNAFLRLKSPEMPDII